MKHCIVYCSPNGSTRHVAEVVAERLSILGDSAEIFDLGRNGQQPEAVYRSMSTPKCLWVGSPVYVNHMVPPVERFLLALEQEKESYAIPFVTWGGVNSGVALGEMAELLTRKGHILLGGAKVTAVHSLMWLSNDPLGAGHPDSKDDAMVKHLVDAVHGKLTSSGSGALSLEVFDYQPEKVKEESRLKSIAVAKQHYPSLAPDIEKCTRCGQCAEGCPSGAITLDPYPVIGEHCILCLKCVRECLESAIPFDMSGMEDRLRSMALLAAESVSTRIFV